MRVIRMQVKRDTNRGYAAPLRTGRILLRLVCAALLVFTVFPLAFGGVGVLANVKNFVGI